MNWSLLIAALIQVESGGDVFAVGDGGDSVGCLQIQVAVLQDVNRVYGKNYRPNARYDKTRSEEVCGMYLAHYGRHYTRVTGEQPTMEVYARIWNGGPNGWKKPATEKYWDKVQLELMR